MLAAGKSDAALADFKEALQIYAALVAKDKFRASWQRNLALTHQRLGEALQAEGKLPEALAEFQACGATQSTNWQSTRRRRFRGCCTRTARSALTRWPPFSRANRHRQCGERALCRRKIRWALRKKQRRRSLRRCHEN